MSTSDSGLSLSSGVATMVPAEHWSVRIDEKVTTAVHLYLMVSRFQ